MALRNKKGSSDGRLSNGLYESESNDNIMGNKFGSEIEFREGAPIQLLKYEDDGNGNFGKIVLNHEALDIIRGIREPLAIISVGK